MIDRRALIAGASALAATRPAGAAPYGTIPPLKSRCPYPLGVAVRAPKLADDPVYANLVATHFSRLTPEWEMKMEYILRPDGSFQWDRPDAMVDFAQAHGMAFHGHTLVWYAEDGDMFQKLKGKPNAFLNFYVDYIQTVMKRYRGRIHGWDVVNEPIMEEGEGLRQCLWNQVLGDDYVGLALTAAHEADPDAVLLVNDYYLEIKPKKRATFLKMCERLLKSGAPLHGIGTQSHMFADIQPGLIKTAIRDIASLGLKVHVAEVDISVAGAKAGGNQAEPRFGQIRALTELVEAYHDVPAAQRYGFTFWGVRDSDSWLNGPKEFNCSDEPLLFDRSGRPKPLAMAYADLTK